MDVANSAAIIIRYWNVLKIRFSIEQVLELGHPGCSYDLVSLFRYRDQLDRLAVYQILLEQLEIRSNAVRLGDFALRSVVATLDVCGSKK